MTKPHVEIVEVGVRDGLQNEAEIFPTAKKLSLIAKAINAGLGRIEVASFVHPKLVPQMADAEAVIDGLPKDNHTTFIGLVLNKRGYFRALEAMEKSGVKLEIGCVAVASDSFGQKNQGQSSDESVTVASEILKLAANDGVRAQVTISTAFGCPYDGHISPSKVIDMSKKLSDADPVEIAIADTIGSAVPNRVRDMFGDVKLALPHMPLRGHFHNTRNTGVANAWAAYEGGANTIDASIAGLGGCPFAPNATGNTATEDIVHMFEHSNIDTGLDIERLIKISHWLEAELGRPLPGMVSRAGAFPKLAE